MNHILDLISIFGANPHIGGTDGFFLANYFWPFINFAYFSMGLWCKIYNGDNIPLHSINKHKAPFEPNLHIWCKTPQMGYWWGFLASPFWAFVIFPYFSMGLCCELISGDNRPLFNFNKHETRSPFEFNLHIWSKSPHQGYWWGF